MQIVVVFAFFQSVAHILFAVDNLYCVVDGIKSRFIFLVLDHCLSFKVRMKLQALFSCYILSCFLFVLR